MTEEQPQMVLAEDAWVLPYVNFLLLAGLASLIFLAVRYLGRPREKSRGKVEPWTVDWLNFGMFLWLMFICVLLSSLLLNTFGHSGQGQENGDKNVEVWQIIMGGISMQAGMILVFGYYLRVKPELFLNKFNAQNLSALKALSIGVLLFLAVFPVIFLVGYGWQALLAQLAKAGLDLPQEPQELVYHLTRNISVMARISLILMATVTAPIVEELVFRGAIYRFLKSRMNPVPAVLVSAILFSSIHFNLVSFPSLVVLGIFLCLAYEITGNLKAPVFLHAIFNINSLLLISNFDSSSESGYSEAAVALLFF